MFGQLMGCGSLRELTVITIAHGKKSFHLGFGTQPITRQVLSKATTFLRSLSSTWSPSPKASASRRSSNFTAGYTQSTLQPSISAWQFSSGQSSEACYVFDRGYFDLVRLYQIHVFGSWTRAFASPSRRTRRNILALSGEL